MDKILLFITFFYFIGVLLFLYASFFLILNRCRGFVGTAFFPSRNTCKPCYPALTLFTCQAQPIYILYSISIGLDERKFTWLYNDANLALYLHEITPNQSSASTQQNEWRATSSKPEHHIAYHRDKMCLQWSQSWWSVLDGGTCDGMRTTEFLLRE